MTEKLRFLLCLRNFCVYSSLNFHNGAHLIEFEVDWRFYALLDLRPSSGRKHTVYNLFSPVMIT